MPWSSDNRPIIVPPSTESLGKRNHDLRNRSTGVYQQYPLTEDEEADLASKLNRPDLYFNEDNLRRAYRDPGGTLVDFIRAALGMLRIKGRDEKLEENFRAWLVSKSLTPEQAQYLSLLKNRGITKGKIEIADLFAPPLSILNAGGLGVELFGEQGLKDVVADLNATVFHDKNAA